MTRPAKPRISRDSAPIPFLDGRGVIGVVVGAMLALAAIGVAGAQTIWLDEPLQQWNQAAASVPTAPPHDPAVQAMCHNQERAASTPEETQVASAGWYLETYWPTERQGNAAIVLGTANYDGMCRPLEFNAFVFSSGTFAGTLSPVNMNSRTDGVLQSVPTFLPNGEIQAVFNRYASTDPLCCPSRPASIVTYQINQTAGGPVVNALQIAQATPSVTPVPSPTRAALTTASTSQATPAASATPAPAAVATAPATPSTVTSTPSAVASVTQSAVPSQLPTTGEPNVLPFAVLVGAGLVGLGTKLRSTAR